MSSYYLDALLSKYTAAGCFFPNAERSSSRSGLSGEDCGFAWPVYLHRLFVDFITSIMQCTTARQFFIIIFFNPGLWPHPGRAPSPF